ncbi:hypothetical protein STRIP9103_02100 [Streptomyces ipomoeae 91-03]|uniref:Uncharacterized protein n=1 Tax=Streptomyces ipomoeae 91-03 TaxID=698759 RepID=L1KQB0_9ACTN|nr:hypothetical protein STRIP9103_02100 [Streptomyces ipomoeae 91-03]
MTARSVRVGGPSKGGVLGLGGERTSRAVRSDSGDGRPARWREFRRAGPVADARPTALRPMTCHPSPETADPSATARIRA